MADHSFALELESVIIQKFGTLIGGAQLVPDKESAIDVTLQVQEVSIFESIFSPVIRAEIAVYDFIGLFVNFPLTGEEAVFVRYRNVGDTDYTTLQFVIDTIDNINFSDAAREMGYVIKCVSIEAYTNAKQNVQDVYDKLVNCMDSLNQALTSVEKEENRQRIATTLNAVDNAIEKANHTLANYQE